MRGIFVFGHGERSEAISRPISGNYKKATL